MNDVAKRLKGISVSYVQDEDRLLLEILLEGASRPLWITRRAALRVIDIFHQQLAGITSPTAPNASIPAEKKAPIAFERDIAATKNPPKPGVMKLNLEQVRSGETRVGVLKTMQFAKIEGEPVLYQVNFVDTHDQAIGLKMTRELLLNLETLLMQQVERAQWQ